MFFSLNPTAFPPSLVTTTLWTLMSLLDLHAQELFSVGCGLQTEAGRCWDVPLMISGAGRVIWLFSQQQNLPRKGGKLLFFAHFVSHVSDLASIVFCVFCQLKISIACQKLKHQCHTKCIPTQTAATIPWVWREGFNKGKQGDFRLHLFPTSGGQEVLHCVCPSAQLSCWNCIHHCFSCSCPNSLNLK